MYTEAIHTINNKTDNRKCDSSRDKKSSYQAIVEGNLKVAPIDQSNKNELAKLDAMRLEYKPKDIIGGQYYLYNERQYDQGSFLLGIYLGLELIGSIRFVPFTDKSSYLNLNNINCVELSTIDKLTTAEASRLFITRKYRRHVRLSLYLISRWMLEYTKLNRYVAISVEQFISLYLAGGAEVLRENISLKGRENNYSLVQGIFNKMLNIKTATKNKKARTLK